jgi:hypothetical protein
MITPNYLTLEQLADRWGLPATHILWKTLTTGDRIEAGILITNKVDAIEIDEVLAGEDYLPRKTDDYPGQQVRIKGFYKPVYIYTWSDLLDPESEVLIDQVCGLNELPRYALKKPISVSQKDMLFAWGDVVNFEEKNDGSVGFSEALDGAKSSFPLNSENLSRIAPNGLCQLSEVQQEAGLTYKDVGREVLSGKIRLLWEFIRKDTVVFSSPDKGLIESYERFPDRITPHELHNDNYLTEFYPGYYLLSSEDERGIASMLIENNQSIDEFDLGWEIGELADVNGFNHHLINYEMGVIGEQSENIIQDRIQLPIPLTIKNVFLSLPETRTRKTTTRTYPIKVLMMRYLDSTQGSGDLLGCIEYLLADPEIDEGINGKIIYSTYGGKRKSVTRKTLQNHFAKYRNEWGG